MGDPTTAPHGTLTPGPGCLTVRIGGMAAWRAATPAAAAAASAANAATVTALTTLASATAAAKASGVGAPAAQTAENAGAAAAAATASSSVSGAAAGSDLMVCPCIVPMCPCTAIPPPPHGPGVVLKGSLTVMIGGLPAARQGDPIMEAVGGSNSIMMGCPTVMIGG